MSAAVEYRRRSHRTRRRIWLLFAALAVIAIGVLSYRFRTPLMTGFDLLVEETGSATAAVVCLTVGLLGVLWAILWLLLPIVVYIGLKDLRRRASELDETTKLCARHLARLSANRDLPGSTRSAKSLDSR